MKNITDQFVALIYEMSLHELPEHILDCAKNCFLDYIGVAIGGGNYTKSVMEQFLNEENNPGDCHMIGITFTTDFRTASMVNAYNSHVLELDDGHRLAMMHLASPIFSSLLSVAEKKDKTVEQVLHASVIGYEAAVRIGRVIQPEHKKNGFHATGTCGTIGCAMAIAAMLHYSESEIKNVLSAAATSGAGLLETINGPSQQKPYNIANAVSAGINAALFGKYFEGPTDILGGERGFFNNFSDCLNLEKLENLVEKNDLYAIESIYMKPYAACRHCHAPIEATLNLRKEFSENKKIKHIEVKTYDLAVLGHDHQCIDGVNSAKMSIPYGVAVSWLYQQCGMEMFDEEKITDKDILELVEKISVIEDGTLSALVPDKRAAIVTVEFVDGSSGTYRVDYPKGEPENPMSDQELMEKFYSICQSSGRKKEWCDKIIKLVYTSETVSISMLFEALKANQE